MSFKAIFLPVLMCILGIVLTGCQSDSSDNGADPNQSKSEKVTKAVVKGAAKAAIRHSPAAIIKSVK